MIKGGRSGLDDIDVTPAVFLQLHEQLRLNKDMPFNRNQLLLAFSKYMHSHKGAWKRDEIKNFRELHGFAEHYVAKQIGKLNKKNLAQDPKSTTLSKEQKQAQNFLKERGLKLMDDTDLPHGSQDAKSSAPSAIMNSRNLERGVDVMEIATELLSVARAADPGVAVAAVLLSYALLPNISTMAIRGTNLLIEKYDRRTKTDEEKSVVLHGLEIVTSKLEPKIYQDKLRAIAEKEKNNPHADHAHLDKIDKMQVQRIDKKEADMRIDHAKEKPVLFSENMDIGADVRRAVAEPDRVQAFLPPKPAAPKPNFDDPAFQSTKDEHA